MIHPTFASTLDFLSAVCSKTLHLTIDPCHAMTDVNNITIQYLLTHSYCIKAKFSNSDKDYNDSEMNQV